MTLSVCAEQTLVGNCHPATSPNEGVLFMWDSLEIPGRPVRPSGRRTDRAPTNKLYVNRLPKRSSDLSGFVQDCWNETPAPWNGQAV